ncbi:14367_t:CDS:2 [Entrophospora sp. SA101]|nr:14367_t:CDS:2 [Entrophospora sp. SA101]
MSVIGLIVFLFNSILLPLLPVAAVYLILSSKVKKRSIVVESLSSKNIKVFGSSSSSNIEKPQAIESYDSSTETVLEPAVVVDFIVEITNSNVGPHVESIVNNNPEPKNEEVDDISSERNDNDDPEPKKEVGSVVISSSDISSTLIDLNIVDDNVTEQNFPPHINNFNSELESVSDINDINKSIIEDNVDSNYTIAPIVVDNEIEANECNSATIASIIADNKIESDGFNDLTNFIKSGNDELNRESFLMMLQNAQFEPEIITNSNVVNNFVNNLVNINLTVDTDSNKNLNCSNVDFGLSAVVETSSNEKEYFIPSENEGNDGNPNTEINVEMISKSSKDACDAQDSNDHHETANFEHELSSSGGDLCNNNDVTGAMIPQETSDDIDMANSGSNNKEESKVENIKIETIIVKEDYHQVPSYQSVNDEINDNELRVGSTDQSNNEDWLKKAAEFEAELRISGNYNLDNCGANFSNNSIPISLNNYGWGSSDQNGEGDLLKTGAELEPEFKNTSDSNLDDDDAKFSSNSIPIESPTSLNNYGWGSSGQNGEGDLLKTSAEFEPEFKNTSDSNLDDDDAKFSSNSIPIESPISLNNYGWGSNDQNGGDLSKTTAEFEPEFKNTSNNNLDDDDANFANTSILIESPTSLDNHGWGSNYQNGGDYWLKIAAEFESELKNTSDNNLDNKNDEGYWGAKNRSNRSDSTKRNYINNYSQGDNNRRSNSDTTKRNNGNNYRQDDHNRRSNSDRTNSNNYHQDDHNRINNSDSTKRNYNNNYSQDDNNRRGSSDRNYNNNYSQGDNNRRCSSDSTKRNYNYNYGQDVRRKSSQENFCGNCKQVGHSSFECPENEKKAKMAWNKLLAADAKKDLEEVNEAFEIYTKAAPHETFQSIEMKLKNVKSNCRMIAIEREGIPLTKCIADLQGNKGKKYVASLIMIPPHTLPRSAGIRAQSEQENFDWLADAGQLVDDFSAPICFNCRQRGHLTRECTQPKPILNNRCKNCGSIEHSTRFCKNENRSDDNQPNNDIHERNFDNENNHNNNRSSHIKCFKYGSTDHNTRSCARTREGKDSQRQQQLDFVEGDHYGYGHNNNEYNNTFGRFFGIKCYTCGSHDHHTRYCTRRSGVDLQEPQKPNGGHNNNEDITFGRLFDSDDPNDNNNNNSLFNKECFKCGSSRHIAQYCTHNSEDSQQQQTPTFVGGGRDRHRDSRDGENNSFEHLSRYCTDSPPHKQQIPRDRYRDNNNRFEGHGTKRCFKCGSSEHLANYFYLNYDVRTL